MKVRLKLAVAALLTIGMSSVAAYADSLNFTLNSPNGSVPESGGSRTYSATVSASSANTGAIFLNGDSFNVTAPIKLDDTGFFTNFPITLAPGASFTGDLFTLTAPAGSPFGTFLGTFSLLGGSNAGSTSVLGTANFSVATTPEPSSVVLTLTAMAGLGIAFFWTGSRETLRGVAR